MFTPTVKAHLSHAQKLTIHQNRDLFHGLDKISKNEGRIYKKIDSEGREKFFKAKDFWSSVYHFFFSARMSEDDLLSLENRVSRQLNNSNNLKLNAKVTAKFVEVLRKVNTNSTWFFPREEALTHLLSSPHLNLIENAAKKIVNGTQITIEELLLLKELNRTPESFRENFDNFENDVNASLRVISDRYEPIYASLRGINQDREIEKYNNQTTVNFINNLGIMKPSLGQNLSVLSENQIAHIRTAERVLANLQRTYNRLDLQSFHHIEGLKNIFEICDYSKFIKPEVKVEPQGRFKRYYTSSSSSGSSSSNDSSVNSSSNDSDSDSEIQPISNIKSRPKIESLDNRLSSLLKRVPNFELLDNSTISDELKKLKTDKKKSYENWLNANIDELPTYFKPQNLDELLDSLKAERSKEILHKKHDIADSAISPISYTDWKDIPPSYLYIPEDTSVNFYDLSPGKDSDLPAFQNVFNGNWTSPATTVPYSLDAWFAFISICRENNIVEVNPLDHLKNAFITMKEAKIAEIKRDNVYTKDDEAYTAKDWTSFVSLCNKNDIEIYGNKHETILISIVMEKLINDIIAEERNEYDFNVIEPYLDVLNDPIVQNSSLPDIGGMKVSEELTNILNGNMHRAAIYLWNTLRDQKIITSAPNEKLIKSAKGLSINLR